MNEQEDIYKKIYNIAQELVNSNSTFKRVDLAFELKSLGVKGDSVEVSSLVWEAFRKYDNNHCIEVAFLTNDESEYIVKEYELYQQLTQGNDQEFLSGLEGLIYKASSNFNTLNQLINGGNTIVSNEVSKINLVSLIGSGGSVNVQEQASLIFDKYSNMVNGYEELRGSVKEIINQFVILRDDVASLYRDYSLGLVDVFGDSIKVISPTLFDFEKIEYLDTRDIFNIIEIEYNKLATSCGVLMEEIGDSFKQTLKRSTKVLGNSKGNKAMMALAVVNMVGHYMDAAHKTQVLKNELVNFKSKVNYDMALITGDAKRLMTIHKILNELYIPKAHIFYRYAREIMQSEYQELIASIYNTPNLKKLKDDRDLLLKEYNYLGKRINDSQQNISYYNNTIANNKSFIKEGQDEYEQAKSLKPSKSFLMLLGIGRASYNREIYEWQNACIPVIKGFETAKLNLKLDSDELDYINSELQKDLKRYKELHSLLKISNKYIAKELHIDDDLKVKIAENLEVYIKLLRIAKDIIEGKLDNDLTKVIQIEKIEEITLSEDMKQRLNQFTDNLKIDLMIDEKIAKQDMMFLNNDMKQQKTRTKEEQDKYKKENVIAMMHAQNKLVNSAVDLTQAWIALQVNERISARDKQFYVEQVEKLQQEIKIKMEDVDNKGIILREVIRKINIAENQDQVKLGLLMLSELSGEKLTTKDIDDLLNGNKIIEV